MYRCRVYRLVFVDFGMQPKKQIGIAAGKRAEAHVLVVGVSEERIAGTKIHRRNTDLAEPCHVCPPVFGFGLLPDSRDK